VELRKYLTNSMEPSPSREAHSHSASQEIPCFYWTQRFITMFKTAHHWFLSRARWIQSTSSQFIHQRSIL